VVRDERDKLRVVLRGVLFDWRGTLVADPPDEWWLCKAMERLGRDTDDLGELGDALDAASRNDDVAHAMRSADCSSSGHREATMLWFQMAGLDDELAAVLYDLDFEAEHHAFFPDVADTLYALRARGVAAAVVSDIHFDLRPEFASAGLGDLVDTFVLSFEHGVQKPDPVIFRLAARSLALDPDELLMVGDRATHDGGAVALGITTLLLPSLPAATEPRGLAIVLGLLDGSDRPSA
jgi:HAD superfamily hydrolase (TIGR01509 family)